jgi:hypothetical protein
MLVVNQDFRKALTILAKQDIPLKTGFKLKGILKRVDEEYMKYEECRKDALSRFGEKDQAGNVVQDDQGNVKLSKEGMDNFIKELQDLLQSDIDLPRLTVADLGEKLTMTTEQLLLLDDLVVES